MRKLVISAAIVAMLLPQTAALAQPVPPRGYDERYDDDRYDDRGVADMDMAQRRFDAAQRRFDREREAYERERAAFDDARARAETERERLAAYEARTWRGPDGQNYCRRPDGTTGTIVGGVAGGLLGRAIDGGRRSAVGTIIGAGAGALLGRGIEKNSNVNCR